jgi:cytochrome b pre-mRNA-processing protein 3
MLLRRPAAALAEQWALAAPAASRAGWLTAAAPSAGLADAAAGAPAAPPAAPGGGAAPDAALPRALLSRARSLEFPRSASDPAAAAAAEGGALRRALLHLGGYYAAESRDMRAASCLYAAAVEAADDGALRAALALPPGFQPAHAFLGLHVWLLLSRLRAEGAAGRGLAQALHEEFQADAEARVRAAGVRVRVGRELTELEKQFFGSALAYDRALEGGEGAEPLAAALARNVYGGAPPAAAAAAARYARRELACLAMTDGDAVLAGNVRLSAAGGGAAGGA